MIVTFITDNTMYSNVFVHSFLEWIGSCNWPDQFLIARATSDMGCMSRRFSAQPTYNCDQILENSPKSCRVLLYDIYSYMHVFPGYFSNARTLSSIYRIMIKYEIYCAKTKICMVWNCFPKFSLVGFNEIFSFVNLCPVVYSS